MLKIQIIEKQKVTAIGLDILLRERLGNIDLGLHPNVREAADAAAGKMPDLILFGIDGRISDLANLSDVEYILRLFPAIRIVAYGEEKDFLMMRALFRAGVTGYFLRRDVENQVVDCVRSALEGQRFISLKASVSILEYFDSGTVARSGNPIRRGLSLRELEVARYLNKGLRTMEIAKRMAVKSPTVSATKSRLFKKLNIRNISELRIKLGNAE